MGLDENWDNFTFCGAMGLGSYHCWVHSRHLWLTNTNSMYQVRFTLGVEASSHCQVSAGIGHCLLHTLNKHLLTLLVVRGNCQHICLTNIIHPTWRKHRQCFRGIPPWTYPPGIISKGTPYAETLVTTCPSHWKSLLWAVSSGGTSKVTSGYLRPASVTASPGPWMSDHLLV